MQRLNDLAALLGNLIVVLLPSRCNPLQDLCEAGLTVAVFRRKISAADEWLQIGRQPNAHGPAAAACRRLHKGHVNPVNIRPLFPVHLNVDELAIHDCGHVLIFE